MFRKVFNKLRGEKKPQKAAPAPKPAPIKKEPSSPKVLTAEGWKRLMMKKYRKS